MTNVPQAPVDALAAWLRTNVIADERTAWDGDYEACALAAVELVEDVWPHSAPGRDPHSSTSGSFERRTQSVTHQETERGKAQAFGFGPPGVTA